MGWFDEQIRQRKAADDEVFSDSFAKMASSVLGRHAAGLSGEHAVTEESVGEILKYYHCDGRRRSIPDSIKDFDEELEYLLRPFGIMSREITLRDKWFKESFGAILAFDAEKGTPVALIPSGLSGYSYSDITSGKKVKVNRKNAAKFREKALCFYRPLPLRKIGLTDFISYMKDCAEFKDIFLLAVLVVAVTVLGMLTTQLTRTMTGIVLVSGNISMLSGLLCFMICTAGSSALIMSARELLANKVYVKISTAVEAAFMMRILSLPSVFFRKYNPGELAERAQMSTRICYILLEFVFLAAVSILMAVFYLGQFLFFAGKLVFPAFLILLTMASVTALTTVLQIKRSKQIMELSAKESGISISLISGVQKIRLAGAEKRAFAKWADIFSEQTNLTYNLPMLLKLNGGSAILPSSSGRGDQSSQDSQRTFLTVALMLTGNLVFYYTAASNGITPSDYFAFNAGFGMIIGAFNSLASASLKIAQLNPMLSMIEPVLTTVPEISEDKKILSRLSGNIELNKVSFRYGEKMPYIIKNLSLKIRSGEYIAVVGRTGCGKSTLLRILLGFEKPERGAVYYDGKDLSTVDLKSLRRMIGTVIQDGQLFQGDIYSNIVISSPKLTIDDAWKAAELAGIADDIRAMPMGMHTLISEGGGGGISGGQKQRLMIARAIAPRPKILMFDEATSALDNITQKVISESLASLECTRIVIAHRLSTVQNCDRILVLEGGQIIEEGNYETLTRKKGVFASLVERQQI